jgi:hypothetical protein
VAVEAGQDLQDTVRDEVSQRAPEVRDTLKGLATTVKDQLRNSAGRVAEEAKREISGPSAEGEGAPT